MSASLCGPFGLNRRLHSSSMSSEAFPLRSDKIEELVLVKSGFGDNRHQGASFDFVMPWHWDDRLASRKVDVATPLPDRAKPCLAQRLDDFTPREDR